MQEIKKIYPSSLARYLSIIAAMAVLLSGSLNFVFSAARTEVDLLKMYWWQELLDVLIGTIFAYVIFWVIGYLFAGVYNFLSTKTRGIIIEMEDVDLESLSLKKIKEDKKEDEERFVV